MTGLQFFGALIIVNSLVIMAFAIANGLSVLKAGGGAVVGCAVGIALTLGNRGYEFKSKIVSLKAEAEQGVQDIGIMVAAVKGHQREIEILAIEAKETTNRLDKLSASASESITNLQKHLDRQVAEFQANLKSQETNAKALFDRLAVDLEDAKNRLWDVQDITESLETAKIDMIGEKFEGGVTIRTPMADRIAPYLEFLSDNEIGVKTTPEALLGLQTESGNFRDHPAPYFWRALALHKTENWTFHLWANMARARLEKTTKVPGHRSDHDDALEQIRFLLKTTPSRTPPFPSHAGIPTGSPNPTNAPPTSQSPTAISKSSTPVGDSLNREEAPLKLPKSSPPSTNPPPVPDSSPKP